MRSIAPRWPKPDNFALIEVLGFTNGFSPTYKSLAYLSCNEPTPYTRHPTP